MKIHILMHESFEAPGAIETWAKQKNHEIAYTCLYKGNAFPNNCDFDFLIIMGGPQSPSSTDCSHFDAPQEITFIQKTIREGKIVLGICLGAQLIGEALGAQYEHSPHKEIGVFEVTLTPNAKGDPLFSQFPQSFLVGHWHGDMPGLTLESKVLAKSKGCPRQIVRYTPKVYGFQCHFEFNHTAIQGMIQSCGHELQPSLLYVQTKEELLKNDYDSINILLFRFLDYMENTYSL